ncbi:hypothetical protein DITRI_Ditri14bG0137100 [Diplodiscus trichospermus]
MMMIGGNNQVITQNEGGASSGMNNKGGREGGLKLKKGPWTAAEDVVLAEYVRTHGDGNWNAVQKNTGLARCGKSCRLRWANHLRPNLKKGAFSPEEERIIVELHAKMGNKWARMAAQQIFRQSMRARFGFEYEPTVNSSFNGRRLGL